MGNSPSQRTAAGLFIPEKAQESLNEAVVVATGPGASDKVGLQCTLVGSLTSIVQDGKVQPCAVKTGDRILLPPFGGNNIKLGNEEYIIYRDSEILAKLADK